MNLIKISALGFLLTLIFAQQQISAQSPSMIEVQGGTFKMGSNKPSLDGIDDEKPVHSVTVSDFYIGEHEVTVAEYKKFAQEVGKTLPGMPDEKWWDGHPDTKRFYNTPAKKWWGLKDNYPMHKVDWSDAVEYCNWLSEKEGLELCYTKDEDDTWVTDITKNGYRLPTEAEWEFAARGGLKSKHTTFSGSNDVKEVAWVDETTAMVGPQNVKTKKPNELGIYDMSGNVWEWCSDYYSMNYYAKSDGKINPINKTPQAYRVVRGGGWHYQPNYASVTSRDGPKNGYTNYNYGFRLARTKK